MDPVTRTSICTIIVKQIKGRGLAKGEQKKKSETTTSSSPVSSSEKEPGAFCQ